MADVSWFGARLRQLREARGLSRAQLGDLSGRGARAVEMLELRSRDPGLSLVLDMAQALGVPVQDLLTPPTEVIPKRGPGRPPLEERKPRKPYVPTGRPRGRPRKEDFMGPPRPKRPRGRPRKNPPPDPVVLEPEEE